MAIGDKAAAKGLMVWPSTQDKREGYQNDNWRGDDIADVIDRVEDLEALPTIHVLPEASPDPTGLSLGDIVIKY